MAKRENWIDFMKVLGMVFIIWGHFFPDKLSAFIYSFSVPTFFIISGYLSKTENTFTAFWKKNLYSLVIPYFILSFIKAFGYMIKHVSDGEFIWSLIGITTGFHTLNGAPGAKNLWFVFTLLLIKIIYQLVGNNKKALISISLLCILGTVVYNYYLNFDISWSVLNVLPTLPFFVIGNLLSTTYKDNFTFIHNKIKSNNKLIISILSIIAFLSVYAISILNQDVWLHRAQYGNYIVLLYINGVIGAIAIYLTSLIFKDIKYYLVQIISIGTILILTFHMELIHPIRKLFTKLNIVSFPEHDVFSLLASFIILLAFIPIIIVVNKFIPILIGYRKVKK